MPVLSTNTLRRLSLGFPTLENAFQGFELGDFGVLRGNAASFMCFALSVRAQLPLRRGGLGSSIVFVDGGNTFNPYLVTEIAREYSLDSRAVLEKIHVSRAFTAYHLSSLIREDLDSALKSTKAELLIVSDITSLFLDRDVPKIEAEEIFIRVCAKLSEIAEKKQTIVVASYFPERRSMRDLLFETVLFAKCNISIRMEKTGEAVAFSLEDHTQLRAFNMAFTLDKNSLNSFMGV
jgi:hypothetical protein